jgi:hypothetical protein
MSGTDIAFEIPGDLLPEVEVFVAAVQDAAQREPGVPPNEIKLIRTEARPLGPGEIGTYIFYVSAAITAWLSKKWLDTYVWPEVQKRINKPSKRLMEFILAKLGLDKKASN